jgi:hypothetical protein
VWRYFGKQINENIELGRIYDERMKAIEVYVGHMVDIDTWDTTRKQKVMHLYELLTSR